MRKVVGNRDRRHEGGFRELLGGSLQTRHYYFYTSRVWYICYRGYVFWEERRVIELIALDIASAYSVSDFLFDFFLIFFVVLGLERGIAGC